MKLLFVFKSNVTIFGGFEKVINLIFNELKNINIEYNLIVIANERDAYENREKWVSPYNKGGNIILKYLNKRHASIRSLIKIIFNINISDYDNILSNSLLSINRPDIIIINDPFLAKSIKELYNKNNIQIKIIGWYHNSLYHKYNIFHIIYSVIYKKLFKYFSKYIDYHFAISSGIEKQIEKCCEDAKIYLVYNPIERSEFKLIKKSKNIELVYIGRLDDRQKNISFLLSAISKVQNMQWKLKIIGSGPDEKKLKLLAKKKKIENRIEWFGYIEKPFNVIEKATALVLTSRYEGFPMVLIEANRHGLPFISSDCMTGPSDILVNGVNGILFKNGDEIDFIKKIQGIIEKKIKFGNKKSIIETTNRYVITSYLDRICNIIKNF